jgi:hypothetical protein
MRLLRDPNQPLFDKALGWNDYITPTLLHQALKRAANILLASRTSVQKHSYAI